MKVLWQIRVAIFWLAVAAGLGVALVVLSGCGIVGVSTNIPYHQTSITLVNESDHPVKVIVNGNTLKADSSNEDFILYPGNYINLKFSNWSHRPAEVGITVISTKAGRAAYNSFYVSGYYGRHKSWAITNRHFDRRNLPQPRWWQ